MRVSFTIDGKPKGKDRPRSSARVYHGEDGPKAMVNVHSDPKMVAAEHEIARLYKIAARGHQTQTGPIRLRILAVFPIPTSWPRALQRRAREEPIWYLSDPDIDQIEKLICDALNKIAYADDGQIAVVEKMSRYGDRPRTEVTIEALAQPEGTVTPGQRRLEKEVAERGWDAVLAPAGRRRSPSKADMPARMSAADFRKLGPGSKARVKS